MPASLGQRSGEFRRQIDLLRVPKSDATLQVPSPDVLTAYFPLENVGRL
jgi:hypothetical protein